MRILFINPSLRRGAPTKYLPVGIASVMTFVRHSGYDFDLLDVDVDDKSDGAIVDYLSRQDYDIVMTGCIVTHYKWIKWLTHTVRRLQPSAKIVVGNSVGGSIPELILRKGAADVVVIGEGEFSAVEVVRAIGKDQSLGTVAGIAFLDEGGNFVKTPKRKAGRIDDLPMIDWDLFDHQGYFSRSDTGAFGLVFHKDRPPRVMPVVTARGCAFKCTFCHYVFWNDPYRHRSANSILTEIARDIEKYGATYISFWDDLSFSTLPQAEALVDAILRSGLKFNWSAAIRSDLFGRPRWPYAKRMDLAAKFKESGCVNLGFSLESGNQGILDMMEKRIEPGYFLEQVQVLRKVGINSTTSVVFGYPIETRETILETMDMCLDAGVYPSIGFLLPLPSTGMYEYAKEHGFIRDEDRYLESITERQDICLNMTELSDQEIMDSIKEGARELNRQLELGLSEDRYIKTGGYRNQATITAGTVKPAPLDPDNMQRNENDVSFNYSQALFDIDLRQAANKEGNPKAGRSLTVLGQTDSCGAQKP